VPSQSRTPYTRTATRDERILIAFSSNPTNRVSPWRLFVAIAGAALLVSAKTLASVPGDILSPSDVAYPGTIDLFVDASDTERRVFRVRETIPVHGPEHLVLLYPQWVPGNHSTTGPIDRLTGLTIRTRGVPLTWVRDPVNVFAFHVDIPVDVESIEVDFQYVSATSDDQGHIVMTRNVMNLEWNAVALYPAGYFIRRIMVEPSVKFPAAWQFGTALDTTPAAGSEHRQGVITFRSVSLETLIDSPIFAGRFFQRFDLQVKTGAPVYLDVVSDRPESLRTAPEHLLPHENLVDQAYKLFGPPPYKRYEFLLALTDELSGVGTEHLASSQNTRSPKYFSDWDASFPDRALLPHEFVHAWNGKYRRPADLSTPNLNVPMRDSLLWIYEGLTSYWGPVLAARSGLMSKEQVLERLAVIAATVDTRPGRAWRDLADTTNDPIINYEKNVPWSSWQRADDYYWEGSLIWLEVDTLIRELSQDTRSLDNFARVFFDISQGRSAPVTYTLDDVVATLEGIQHYDWRSFFLQRLTSHAPRAPLGGLRRGGYALKYTEGPSAYSVALEARNKETDLSWSVGLTLSSKATHEGSVTDVVWDGPAFFAGLTSGSRIIAVKGRAYDSDELKTAIADDRDGSQPVQLIVQEGSYYRVVQIDYRGGLRYPHLERIPGTVDRLSPILSPRD
jgi:predicted metalloprotease with PDZ domain